MTVPAGLPHPPSSPAAIGPDVSTPILRRCTALAARARVDLLTPRRHAAFDELELLLASLEHWEPDAVIDPDLTMLVLAAAALEDLSERLPAGAHPELTVGIDAALELLHGIMDGGRVAAMA